MTVQCHSCHEVFEDYAELAVHIMSTKKGHRKGRTWAATFIAKSTLRPEMPKRAPVDPDHENTDYGNETREMWANYNPFSGQTEIARCKCPSCKTVFTKAVPVEFNRSEFFWRDNGLLMVSCDSCQSKVVRR